jgi:phosphotransferase system enzyme I (PtsI)
MKELAGISASPGIAIGKVFLYLDDGPSVPRYEIDTEEIKTEMQRLHDAVEKAESELKGLKHQRESDEHDEDAVKFLDSHLLMLKDPTLFENVEQKLQELEMNVEWVLYRVTQDLTGKLSASGDEYLRERTADLNDVSQRLLNHLMFRDRISLADLQEEVILVTHDLMPSDALAMNSRMVKGIAMDAGGKTSHTAILARSFEIPAVLGLSEVTKSITSGEQIIVDGNRGTVICQPDENAVKRYLRVQSEWRQHEVQLMGLNELPAETRDGKLIQLKANIEVPEEVDAVLSHGADGIGLYRSEFLFIRPGSLPTEEEQYEAYTHVLQAMNGAPVTIRTLDVGGDKISPGLRETKEKNPILGWRAIRYCLANPELFKTQLRALLRSSVNGALRIMFPMISGLEELSRSYEVLEEVREELRRDGIPFDEEVPVGIMIEVPSAALTADILSHKADFFSIGTNDLIQYTIAVDRGNENIAYLYRPFHPGVLRILKSVIEAGHTGGIPVAMCGEMAGDPDAAVVLLGLGLDEFSMGAVGIPEVKRIVRSVALSEAEEIVGNILEMRSADEIDKYVRETMENRFGVTHYQ